MYQSMVSPRCGGSGIPDRCFTFLHAILVKVFYLGQTFQIKFPIPSNNGRQQQLTNISTDMQLQQAKRNQKKKNIRVQNIRLLDQEKQEIMQLCKFVLHLCTVEDTKISLHIVTDTTEETVDTHPMKHYATVVTLVCSPP